jgi:hypothetical protein
MRSGKMQWQHGKQMPLIAAARINALLELPALLNDGKSLNSKDS